MKKYYIGTMIASIALNAVLIGYSAPLAKAQVKAYAVAKLEDLTGHKTVAIDMDEELVSEKAASMPPKMNIQQIAEKYPAGNSDIIAKLLEGK